MKEEQKEITYEYGEPIPEKFRNRLYDWDGGGYDGCAWEPNAGLVDAEGHWHPLYSTGCAGIDCREWYERKIGYLKAELGYDERNVKVQVDEAKHRHIEIATGKKWYEVEWDPEKYPIPEIDEIDRKYSKFCEERDKLKLEHMHREDDLFMRNALGKVEHDYFREVGQIDDEHIKETCRKFCEDSHWENVGKVAHILDKMAGLGYSPWCTCTDCGCQFQPGDFEDFGCSIDKDSYHGDGGIGVVHTRIICDDCRNEISCEVCYEPNLPNHRMKDGDPYRMYDFLACLMADWLSICWGCADGLDCDHLWVWDEAQRLRVRTELGGKYEAIEERLKERYGLEGHDLYEHLKDSRDGRKEINAIRDLLQKAAEEKFSDSLSEDWFSDRLDIPEQGELPGIEGGKKEENDGK